MSIRGVDGACTAKLAADTPLQLAPLLLWPAVDDALFGAVLLVRDGVSFSRISGNRFSGEFPAISIYANLREPKIRLIWLDY